MCSLYQVVDYPSILYIATDKLHQIFFTDPFRHPYHRIEKNGMPADPIRFEEKTNMDFEVAEILHSIRGLYFYQESYPPLLLTPFCYSNYFIGYNCSLKNYIHVI